MSRTRRLLPLILACLLPLLTSCADPVTDHAIKSFFFDGVPALPTLDKLCEPKLGDLFNDYYEARLDEALYGAEEGTARSSKTSSIHPPFRDKLCLNCHDFTKDNLLQLPKNKLCFKCHKNFITGVFVHGPVAVADCLACHFPHQSPNKSLLRRPRNKICGKCHQERRQAYAMHNRVIARGMFCVDCHNPHSGNVHYFLQ